MARDEQIRLDVTAEDNASEVIEDVADRAEALERARPVEVDVAADTVRAERALEDVAADVKGLDGTTARIDVVADVDPARRALRSVNEDRPGKAAGETFVRDLTGAMGDNASQVGGVFADFAAGAETTFETLGAKIGGKAGPIVSQIGGAFTSVLAVGGVAYVAGKALFDYFSQRAREQKREIEEVYKALEDEAGDAGKALRKTLGKAFEDLDDSQRETLKRAGLNLEDLAQVVEGKNVPAFEALRDAWETVNRVAIPGKQTFVGDLERALGVSEEVAAALLTTAREYETVNGLVNDQASAVAGAVDKWRDLQTLVGPVPVKIDVAGATAAAEAEVLRWASRLEPVLRANVTLTVDERRLQRELDDAIARARRRNGVVPWG